MADYEPSSPYAALGTELARIRDELRRELAEVRASIDDYLDDPSTAPPPTLGQSLSTSCLAFCGALRAHHSREDVTFGDVEERWPKLAPVLDQLRREHRVVADAVKNLQQLFERLPFRAHGEPACAMRSQLARLADDLERHFAFEERELVPQLGH